MISARFTSIRDFLLELGHITNFEVLFAFVFGLFFDKVTKKIKRLYRDSMMEVLAIFLAGFMME